MKTPEIKKFGVETPNYAMLNAQLEHEKKLNKGVVSKAVRKPRKSQRHEANPS